MNLYKEASTGFSISNCENIMPKASYNQWNFFIILFQWTTKEQPSICQALIPSLQLNDPYKPTVVSSVLSLWRVKPHVHTSAQVFDTRRRCGGGDQCHDQNHVMKTGHKIAGRRRWADLLLSFVVRCWLS